MVILERLGRIIQFRFQCSNLIARIIMTRATNIFPVPAKNELASGMNRV